ncbi:MAG: DUF1232 domain-containing protein [Prolixibacteraceae bacterium]|nr:DUF1232 domain-containing protein [Prolixibacteraceae bacterium]
MHKEKVLSGINEGFIKRGAAEVEDDDVQKVMDRASDIRQTVIGSNLLKRFSEDVKLLIAMIKDYWNDVYQDIPWWVIAAVVFALLYVLNPIDLIPDFIPILGLTDDAAVLALCLAMTEKDIQKYRQWKESKEQSLVEA